jgi:hypothetical protein
MAETYSDFSEYPVPLPGSHFVTREFRSSGTTRMTLAKSY